MTQHTCPRCGYSTYQKHSIRSHYQRKLPCSPINANTNLQELLHALDNPPNAKYTCPTCNKRFTSRQGRAHHVRNCTASTNTNSHPITSMAPSVTNSKDETILKLEKQIADLQAKLKSQKTFTYNTNNNTNTTNIMNVINIISPVSNINDFGCERVDHLDPDYLKQCMLKTHDGVKDLITNIHFNHCVPENQNVHFKSLKNKTLLIRKDGRWVEANQNTTLDAMIRSGYKLLHPIYIRNLDSDHDVQTNALYLGMWFNEMMAKNSTPYFNLRRELLFLVKDTTEYLLNEATECAEQQQMLQQTQEV